MKKYLSAALFSTLTVLNLSACTENDDRATAHENTIADSATKPLPAAQKQTSQPRIPETVDDPEWQKRYSPDIPYYNRSGAPLPAFAGADPRTALVGKVAVNEGGYVKTCALNSSFCKITFGEKATEGYVDMNRLSGYAN